MYRYQYRVSGRYFIKIKYSDSFFIADTTHRYHGLRDGGGGEGGEVSLNFNQVPYGRLQWRIKVVMGP